INPQIVISPKEAFYGEQESIPLMQSAGRISCEFVMCYPPGIPIIAPGERLTPEILENIDHSKKSGCFMTGTEDMNLEYIRVIK
ncbi:MAG: arginine decarboxylase, partial [Oscillospiraceae bacterium]|nr:arginine decarboxylase [Oscillospiraceae bacterium]